MHLSVLIPRKLSAEEMRGVDRFLQEAGFEKVEEGSYRVSGPFPLSARFEVDPGEDPFWVACSLDSLFFLPREEILMTSEGEGRSHERMYRLAAGLAKEVLGFIYDHQIHGVYGPGGKVLEDYGTEGNIREYGAVLQKHLKKEEG